MATQKAITKEEWEKKLAKITIDKRYETEICKNDVCKNMMRSNVQSVGIYLILKEI
jgi:hypothetical protein